MSECASEMENSDYISKMMSERRKAKKPIMEKMRRDRINGSLQEMKKLVLEAMNKDVSRYSKMEKADMLEMTVKYLRSHKRRERSPADSQSLAEYRAGFNRCASNLTQELLTSDIPEHLRTTILTHLATTCQTVAAATDNRFPNTIPPSHNSTAVLPTPPVSTATHVPRTALVWVPAYPSPPPSPSEKATVRSQARTAAVPLGKSPVVRGSYTRNILPVTSSSQMLNTFPSLVWRPWS